MGGWKVPGYARDWGCQAGQCGELPSYQKRGSCHSASINFKPRVARSSNFSRKAGNSDLGDLSQYLNIHVLKKKNTPRWAKENMSDLQIPHFFPSQPPTSPQSSHVGFRSCSEA